MLTNLTNRQLYQLAAYVGMTPTYFRHKLTVPETFSIQQAQRIIEWCADNLSINIGLEDFLHDSKKN